MNFFQIRWRRALVGMFGAEIALIVAAFAWVAIYSYLLHPGETPEYYQRYALVASPWVSLLLGFPVFFFASRWAGSKAPAEAWPTAMGLFALFLLVDLPLVLSGGDISPVTPSFLTANYLVKFLACHFGGRSAGRRTAAQPS